MPPPRRESAKESGMISVIMPVYNGERFLSEAIDSILAQTIGNFELIIVDDGSTDGSAQIIKEYAQRDGRVCVLQHGENRGQAAARNSGLAAAQGEYIIGMDADDISPPERLRKQLDFLRQRPDIGVLGTWRRTIDAAAQPIDLTQSPLGHA